MKTSSELLLCRELTLHNVSNSSKSPLRNYALLPPSRERSSRKPVKRTLRLSMNLELALLDTETVGSPLKSTRKWFAQSMSSVANWKLLEKKERRWSKTSKCSLAKTALLPPWTKKPNLSTSPDLTSWSRVKSKLRPPLSTSNASSLPIWTRMPNLSRKRDLTS